MTTSIPIFSVSSNTIDLKLSGSFFLPPIQLIEVRNCPNGPGPGAGYRIPVLGPYIVNTGGYNENNVLDLSTGIADFGKYILDDSTYIANVSFVCTINLPKNPIDEGAKGLIKLIDVNCGQQELILAAKRMIFSGVYDKSIPFHGTLNIKVTKSTRFVIVPQVDSNTRNPTVSNVKYSVTLTPSS